MDHGQGSKAVVEKKKPD